MTGPLPRRAMPAHPGPLAAAAALVLDSPPPGLDFCPDCTLPVRLRDGHVPDHGCRPAVRQQPPAGPWG